MERWFPFLPGQYSTYNAFGFVVIKSHIIPLTKRTVPRSMVL